MKLKPTLEKRRKKLLKVLEEEYPEDSGIPWRGKSFIEKHNREVLPLRADKAKEWVIFSWIATDSQEIFKVKVSEIEGLRFYNLGVKGGFFIKPCGNFYCSKLSCTKISTGYCSSPCARFIDRSGMVFGRLKVLEPVLGGQIVKWKCLCECGTTYIVAARNLTPGNPTLSCGCLRRERTSLANQIPLAQVTDLVKELLENKGLNAFAPSIVDQNLGFYFTDWVQYRTGESYTTSVHKIFPELAEVRSISNGSTGTFERLVEVLLRKFYSHLELRCNHKFWSKYRLKLDFVFPELKLAIEIDGKQHYGGNWYSKESNARDRLKAKLCRKDGIKLLRFNGQPIDHTKEAGKILLSLQAEHPEKFSPPPFVLNSEDSIYRHLSTEELAYVVRNSRPTPEDLKFLYKTKKLTCSKIAGIYNTDKTNVARWLREYGIKCRRRKDYAKPVKCLENGQVYNSARSAAKAVKKSLCSIYSAINNGKECAGKTWSYA